MGSGTEDELRTRNKIKESVQENHRIPVGIRNCVRIVTILTPIWALVAIEDFEVKNPSEKKLMCNCQLFSRDCVLMNDPDSPDEPAKMLVVDVRNNVVEYTRALSVDIIQEFPSLVTTRDLLLRIPGRPTKGCW